MAGILFLVFLTGCSSMGDWLSGPVRSPSPVAMYPVRLDSLVIGLTTQAQVRAAFGAPTDLQTAVRDGLTRETWAYAYASPSINPLQFLPLIGMLALTSPQEFPMFSVSFASDGIVDGVSIRDLQPCGDVPSPGDRFKSGHVVTPYGLNNPMIHALPSSSKAR